MAANLKNLILLLATFWLAAAAVAEDLPDPTRPAVELLPSAGSDATALVTPKPQGLQSVILSGKHEAAIINGTEVRVGQKYGDATLTVVNETCVVLMGPQGRQVMHMFPTVNLSKTELACAGRQGLPTIRKTAAGGETGAVANAAGAAKADNSAAKASSAANGKPARKKKKVVTCVEDNSKNGSGK